jgi:hypothetical protein
MRPRETRWTRGRYRFCFVPDRVAISPVTIVTNATLRFMLARQ